MCRLPVVSGIMAHSEIEIVPVLNVGILTHSQSLIPFARIFPRTAVITFQVEVNESAQVNPEEMNFTI
jgi:hypothetical protein